MTRTGGKFDIFVTLVWLLLLGIVGGAGLWCWSSLRAAGDPRNRMNYWNENMYPYRSAMEAADRLLEQKRYEDARRGYQRAIEGNAQSRTSQVLHDRIARAHFLEGLDLHQQHRFEDAIRAFRSALDAVDNVGAISTGAARNVNSQFESEVTTADEVIDAMVESLVAEGIRLRDDSRDLDGALEMLLEARRRRPAHLQCSVELIQLQRDRQSAAGLLEALRHARDTFPAPGTPQFDQMDENYRAMRADWDTRHLWTQNYVLRQYPTRDWVPFVEGLVLQYHAVYADPSGGEIRGGDFTRTMRLQGADTAIIEETPGTPDYILTWTQVPGIGECLVEQQTAHLTEGEPRTFHLLPANLQMGAAWPGMPNSTFTFRLVDLRADTDGNFRMFIDGWIMPIVITYGVGRTSATPRSEGTGEYLDAVAQ